MRRRESNKTRITKSKINYNAISLADNKTQDPKLVIEYALLEREKYCAILLSLPLSDPLQTSTPYRVKTAMCRSYMRRCRICIFMLQTSTQRLQKHRRLTRCLSPLPALPPALQSIECCFPVLEAGLTKVTSNQLIEWRAQ